MLLFITTLLLGLDDDQTDAAKKEVEKLKGAWKPVAFETSGKPAPEENVKRFRVTFTENTMSIKFVDREHADTVSFVVDPTKKPKEITMVQGLAILEPVRGIYELDGDDLKICWNTPGKDRPTEFATKGKAGWKMYTLKRASQGDKP